MTHRIHPELVERQVARWVSDTKERRKNGSHSARMITISRQLGSGGRRVAEQLSAMLGWHLWDRDILNVLADSSSSSRLQAQMFEALDERAQSDIESLIESFLGAVVTKNLYFYLLPKAILTIADDDAIILGRGAHIILPPQKHALRVRIIASPETRANNLVTFDHLDLRSARHRMDVSDREREEFMSELARLMHRQLQNDTDYDLIINTDHIPIAGAARVIYRAAERYFGLTPIQSYLN